MRIAGRNSSYRASLDAAWADHLAPRASDAPTVISTFAGGGGSSLGYSMAGFRELLAVEWEQNAVDTLRLNFPHMPIHHGDIARLSVEECLRFAGIGPGELDVFDGSPPCQGFSTAGKRQIDDPRNSLFREYVRLLRGLRPKAFVMENVSGMVKGKMKLVFAEILRELKASGYVVKARLLNAMYYGVPQSRQRMIFVGIREDLEIEPGHPTAQSSISLTPRQAFRDVPEAEIKPLPDWLRKAAGMMVPGNYGSGHTEAAFLRSKGKTGGAINTKLLSWDRVSCTLVKSEIAGSGIIHPDRQRYLTIAEMKRIGSFPDHYQFCGKRIDAVNRIGNSVPPLLARAVANHICTLLK